ncbi:MAG: hypothetical protein JWP91_851 [Fibrobacteres bacterium]|nr:hypothetical protein [Fibrobacterota bacterium]
MVLVSKGLKSPKNLLVSEITWFVHVRYFDSKPLFYTEVGSLPFDFLPLFN